MSQALPCSILQGPSKKKKITITVKSRSMLYWDQLFLVGCVFSCSLRGNCFWLVWLTNLFTWPQTWVKELKKHLICVIKCQVIVPRVRTIPKGYRISTGNSWKSVLLRNVNSINPSWLWLKQGANLCQKLHFGSDFCLLYVESCVHWQVSLKGIDMSRASKT